MKKKFQNIINRMNDLHNNYIIDTLKYIFDNDVIAKRSILHDIEIKHKLCDERALIYFYLKIIFKCKMMKKTSTFANNIQIYHIEFNVFRIYFKF